MIKEIKNIKGETADNATVGTGTTVTLETDETFTIELFGDVDGNGKITSNDAQIAFEKAFNGEADDLRCADISGTSGVTSSDAQAIFDLAFANEGKSGYVAEGKMPEETYVAPEVHEHTYTYEQKEYSDGVYQHTWKCSECEETGVEDCVFGEWESSKDENGTTTTYSVCKLCGNKKTETLQEALNEQSVSEVIANKVDTTEADLTVPAGKTLTVTDSIKTAEHKITVNGTLILKTTEAESQKMRLKVANKLKLAGTGTVIYAPEVTDTEAFKAQFPNAENILGAIDVADQKEAKSLKYEIRVPKLDTPQTITETSLISLEEGWNLTVDLGNNILETQNTSSTFITNKGNLTLKNGEIKIPDTSSKFVIGSDGNTIAKLILENVNIIGANGISTNGNLIMTGGKIESNASTSSKALQIHGENAIKATVTELTNVDITAKECGVYIHNDPLHDLVMTNGSITINGEDPISSKATAIWSNSQYSSITLNGTQIKSTKLGIYLQNNAGTNVNVLGGNVAHLNNVNIESTEACMWTCEVGDKVEVTGGKYVSTGSKAVLIYSRELNTFENCCVQGKEKAIYVLGSLLLDANFSDYVARTNVTEIDL